MPKLNTENNPNPTIAEAVENGTSAINDRDVEIDFTENGIEFVDRRTKATVDPAKVQSDTSPAQIQQTQAYQVPPELEQRFAQQDAAINKLIDLVTKIAPKPEEQKIEVDFNDPSSVAQYVDATINKRVQEKLEPYNDGFKELEVKKQYLQVVSKYGQQVTSEANTKALSLIIANNPGITVESAWNTLQAMSKAGLVAGQSTTNPGQHNKQEILDKVSRTTMESDQGIGSDTKTQRKVGKLTQEEAIESAFEEVFGR